jgi:hypothetical protein
MESMAWLLSVCDRIPRMQPLENTSDFDIATGLPTHGIILAKTQNRSRPAAIKT